MSTRQDREVDERAGVLAPPAEEGTSRYRWVILGLALLSQAGAAMAGQVLGPLAPLFQPELG